MKIDAFCHIMPADFARRFQQALEAAGRKFPVWALGELGDLSDVDRRVEMMDELGVDQQAVCLGSPPIDDMIDDKQVAADLARAANDGIAELVSRHPGRLIPVGVIPQADMEFAVLEAERCLKQLGMKGIQIHSNARGRPIDLPEYFPLYALMAKTKAPIWLHPSRQLDRADYPTEAESKCQAAIVFGWAYETSVAMTRLVFAGLFEQHPDIRVIAHHAGASVPLLEGRIAHAYEPERIKNHTFIDHNTGRTAHLQRPILDYYRMFYTDTVSHASTMAVAGAYGFYGARRLLFGSDAPFDSQGGKHFTKSHIEVIEHLMIPPDDRALIFGGNMLRLMSEVKVEA